MYLTVLKFMIYSRIHDHILLNRLECAKQREDHTVATHRKHDFTSPLENDRKKKSRHKTFLNAVKPK